MAAEVVNLLVPHSRASQAGDRAVVEQDRTLLQRFILVCSLCLCGSLLRADFRRTLTPLPSLCSLLFGRWDAQYWTSLTPHSVRSSIALILAC